MKIDTPEDLAEEVADWIGIYGNCDQENCQESGRCCRAEFTQILAERIRNSVHNENAIITIDLKSSPENRQ